MNSLSDRLIVVGASAGGVDALRQLASALPAKLPACVLMVLHIGAYESLLPQLIAADCALPVAHAVNAEPIRPAIIRIAPPDKHLTVQDGRLRVTHGPKENFARPAIDPLFRSAALDFGPRVIGLILTGMLDDGTAGLQAVKAGGGIAVVQDPADAAEPGMPASALAYVEVDHCLPLARLPALLVRLLAHGVDSRSIAMNHRLRSAAHEQALGGGAADYLEHLRQIGQPSPFTCPECHGGLWRISGAVPARFRCHTGHAYTARTLERAVRAETDSALWNALRALHERASVLAELARTSREGSRHEEAQTLERAARQAADQSRVLRALIEQPQASSEGA